MRKRIIPLLAALCLLLCLLPSAALAAEADGTVDQSRSYNFVLTAEKGQTAWARWATPSAATL